jgi:hypothetical protein
VPKDLLFIAMKKQPLSRQAAEEEGSEVTVFVTPLFDFGQWRPLAALNCLLPKIAA